MNPDHAEDRNKTSKRERDLLALRREEFLDALLPDKRVTNAAFRFAYYLAKSTNRKIFEEEGVLKAWPGSKTAATATGLTNRTILDVGDLLEDLGYVRIQQGKKG